MFKLFLKIVISCWILAIIAAIILFLYIHYDQQQARKEFIANFRYDEQRDETTNTSANELNKQTYTTKTYTKKTYRKNTFDAKLKDAQKELLQLEKNVQHAIANESLQTALHTTINAYTQAKKYVDAFAYIEISDIPKTKQHTYSTQALAIANYSQIAAKYFIIQAKALTDSTTTIRNQLQTAQEKLTAAKEALQTK